MVVSLRVIIRVLPLTRSDLSIGLDLGDFGRFALAFRGSCCFVHSVIANTK